MAYWLYSNNKLKELFHIFKTHSHRHYVLSTKSYLTQNYSYCISIFEFSKATSD